MKKFIWMLLIGSVLLLSACRALSNTCVNNEREQHIDRRVDSVIVRDSIVLKQVNDTVLVEKWHTLWKEKQVVKVDTVYVETHTQTAPVATQNQWRVWVIVLIVGVVMGLLVAVRLL